MRESRKITIRLKPEEFQLIEREAVRRNWSLSEVARHLMLQKLDSVSDLSDILSRLDELDLRLRQVEARETTCKNEEAEEPDPFARLKCYEVGELCKNLVRNEAARYIQKEKRRGLAEANWSSTAASQLPQLLRRGLSRRNLAILAEMLVKADLQSEDEIRGLCDEVSTLIETKSPTELRTQYPGAVAFVPYNFPLNILVRPLSAKQIFERDQRWSSALDVYFEDPRS